MNNVKGSKENEEDYKIDFDRIAELIEKYKSEKTQGKITMIQCHTKKILLEKEVIMDLV